MKRILLIILLMFPLAHAQWTEPVRISSSPHLGSPRVAVEGDTLHVSAKTLTKLYYLRSVDNAETWSDPMCPVDTFYFSYINDIVYSNGRLHIAFIGRAHTQEPIKLFCVSSDDHGLTWEGPIEVYYNGWKYPRLAASGDTLFLSSAIPGHILVFRSDDNGESWSGPFTAESEASAIDHDPNLLYSQGRLHLIYQMSNIYDTVGIEIYYRYSDDHGESWSDRMYLSTPEGTPNCKHSQAPSAYVDSSGNIMGLWFDYKYGSECGVTGDILGRVSTDNGDSWLEETRLTYTQTGSGSACIILNDTLYAVWMDYDFLGCGSPKLMHSKSGDWGRTWGLPELIDESAELLEDGPFLFKNGETDNPLLHCIMPAEPVDGHVDLYYTRNALPTGADDGSPAPIPVSSTLTACPNPFNSTTVLTLNGNEGGDAILAIYDVRGRLVKRLNLMESGGGDKKAVWDASDNSGRKVSSGIYFARVGVRWLVATKLVYLR